MKAGRGDRDTRLEANTVKLTNSIFLFGFFFLVSYDFDWTEVCRIEIV